MVPRPLAGVAVILVLGLLTPAPCPLQAAARAQAPGAAPESAAAHPGLTSIAAVDAPAVADWDRRVAQMEKAGELKLQATVSDTLVAGRTHQRYAQLYKGVPVFGGSVSRQVDKGTVVSIFGAVYGGIEIKPVPKLTADEAAALFQAMAGGGLGPSRPPELTVLPTDDGRYRLTYRARIVTAADVFVVFVDAMTGEAVLSLSDLKRPADQKEPGARP